MKLNLFNTNLLRKVLLGLFALASLSCSLFGADDAEESAKEFENPSPDGRHAFLLTESTDYKGIDLVDQKSGKVLLNVAGSDMGVGPGQFSVENVIWKPDSTAFAVTVWLDRRSGTVFVFRREGGVFRTLTLPELSAEIPEKVTRDERFPHVETVDSQSAVHWQKDGTLVMTVESEVNGEDKSATTTRTVTLSFAKTGKAKIVKSSTKFAVQK